MAKLSTLKFVSFPGPNGSEGLFYRPVDEDYLAQLVSEIRVQEPLWSRIKRYISAKKLSSPEEFAAALKALPFGAEDLSYAKVVLGNHLSDASSTYYDIFSDVSLRVGIPSFSQRRSLEAAVLTTQDFTNFADIGQSVILPYIDGMLASSGIALQRTFVPKTWKENLTRNFVSVSRSTGVFHMQTYTNHETYSVREVYATSVDDLLRVKEEMDRHSRIPPGKNYDIILEDKACWGLENCFRSFKEGAADQDIVIETDVFKLSICENALHNFIDILIHPENYKQRYLDGYIMLPKLKSYDRVIYVSQDLFIGQVKPIIEAAFGDLEAAVVAYRNKRDDAKIEMIRNGLLYSPRGDHRLYLARPVKPVEA